MLLTKLEKLAFLLLPDPDGLPPFPSSEYRFVFVERSLSVLFTRASIRLCRAVKLADCLSPRVSGAV
jgi:hypothetical protein